jgi:hypothetical protein
MPEHLHLPISFVSQKLTKNHIRHVIWRAGVALRSLPEVTRPSIIFYLILFFYLLLISKGDRVITKLDTDYI